MKRSWIEEEEEKDDNGIEKSVSRTQLRLIQPGSTAERHCRRSGRVWLCPFCRRKFDTLEECSHHEQTIHPNSKQDEQQFWTTKNKSNALGCRLYAEDALRYLHNQEGPGGKRYELVEPGPAVAKCQWSVFFHINFEAKEADCASAQVETFFAQLRAQPRMVVQCCVSLGPTHELPHWSKAYLGGCTQCDGYVNHPTEKIDGVTLTLKEDDTDLKDEDEDEDEDD